MPILAVCREIMDQLTDETSESLDLQPLIDKVLAHKETYAAIELLAREDALTAAHVYEKVQEELYWKRKDIPRLIALSRAGIQHALIAGKHSEKPEDAELLRGYAKALSYNLASFTWPGWHEEGITLTISDMAAGFDAARLNMRLAEELERPDKAKAKALWALGAHEMAIGKYKEARDIFSGGKAHATRAYEGSLMQMLEGFELLAKVLMSKGDASSKQKFEAAVAKLQAEDSEESHGYAHQLSTAYTVFSK